MSVEQELNADEELSLKAGFDNIESAEDLEDDSPKPKKKAKLKKAEPVEQGGGEDDGEEPKMGTPQWSDFVMQHFEEDELDPDGRPLVAGLRRVATLLLGPIVSSDAHVVQAPSLLSGMEKFGYLQPACVEYRVTIMMCRDLRAQEAAYPVTYGDAADVYFGNTNPDVARHATATASTKAESRALRKALQIKGIAADEKTVVPAAEAMLDGMISPDQVNFLDKIGRRNDVNVKAFINAGKKKYESVWKIEAGTAVAMVEYLAGLENKNSVPEALRGYVDKWLEGE